MKQHTLTITLSEVYVPDSDGAEFRKSIDRIIEDVISFAQYLVFRHLSGDVTLTVAVSHSEKE